MSSRVACANDLITHTFSFSCSFAVISMINISYPVPPLCSEAMALTRKLLLSFFDQKQDSQ